MRNLACSQRSSISFASRRKGTTAYNTGIQCITPIALRNRVPVSTLCIPGGVLPCNRLMGMCRWMGSHFHDWIDYNGVAFSIGTNRVTRMGSHICGILGVSKFRQVGILGIFAQT